MDKELQEKVDNLVKSLKKSMSQAKKRNAIEDVLDSNRVAEMEPDSIAPHSTGVVKKDEHECECEDKDECECDEAPVEEKNAHKSEEVIMTLMKGFDLISQAYLLKQEETRMASEKEKEEIRQKKKTNELWSKWKKQAKKFQEHQEKQKQSDEKMAASEKTMHSSTNQVGKEAKKFARQKAKNKKMLDFKQKKRADLKSKRVETAKENAEELKGVGVEPKFDPMAASEKPFKGYNKEKHSREGGMSEKAREKYNRENNANLKAPVSSKEAKKSPKKAARRKSFCARMKGNKGPTSKDGKLTPKGAALKRWDC